MRQATDQALPLVMVTGASSGIGKALAMAFAREGHPLLLISRHIEPIAGLPEDTVYRQADVADYGAITAAVDAAIAVHGPSAASSTMPGWPMRAPSRRWMSRAMRASSTPT